MAKNLESRVKVLTIVLSVFVVASVVAFGYIFMGGSQVSLAPMILGNPNDKTTLNLWGSQIRDIGTGYLEIQSAATQGTKIMKKSGASTGSGNLIVEGDIKANNRFVVTYKTKPYVDLSDCWEAKGYRIGNNFGLTFSCDPNNDYVSDGVLMDSHAYCVSAQGYPLFQSIGGESVMSNGLVTLREYVCADSLGRISSPTNGRGVCCKLIN